MSWVVAVVIAAAFTILVLVLAFALRSRVQRNWFAGTGIDRWRTIASGFPWRDRLVLYWTNSRGQPAPHRLAPVAVERGEVMLAVIERMTARGSKFRRFWLALAGLWVILLVLNLVMLVTVGGGVSVWLNLLVAVSGLAATFVAIGPWQARQARLMRRSIEANRQQLREQA